MKKDFIILLFFLTLSIMLFDLDLRKTQKTKGVLVNGPESIRWVGFIYLVCIVSWIVILFANWKVALLGVVVYYASAFIPLPQIIGRFFINLFKLTGNNTNGGEE